MGMRLSLCAFRPEQRQCLPDIAACGQSNRTVTPRLPVSLKASPLPRRTGSCFPQLLPALAMTPEIICWFQNQAAPSATRRCQYSIARGTGPVQKRPFPAVPALCAGADRIARACSARIGRVSPTRDRPPGTRPALRRPAQLRPRATFTSSSIGLQPREIVLQPHVVAAQHGHVVQVFRPLLSALLYRQPSVPAICSGVLLSVQGLQLSRTDTRRQHPTGSKEPMLNTAQGARIHSGKLSLTGALRACRGDPARLPAAQLARPRQ